MALRQIQSAASILTHLPKAELHLHLEGCLTPALLLQLARRHGEILSPEEVSRRYQTRTFPEFLELFKWATSYLREPSDYAHLAAHTFRELQNQTCLYSEMTLSVGVMLLRKQDVEANFAALAESAEKQSVRVNWIFDAVRQFGPQKAMDVARLAVQMKSRGVMAFGLGGDEESLPASDFRKVFDYAASENLHRLAHAGETGGPQNICDAVEILGAERIGHGIAAIHDEKLMDLLIARQIPLEICPTSNLRTGALAKLLARNLESRQRAASPLGDRSLPAQPGLSPDIPPSEINDVLAPVAPHPTRENVYAAGSNQPRIEDHPLAKFVARGVPVTLASDDPAMFGTTLLAEYSLASNKMGLTPRQLVSLAEASFRHAFLPAAEKQSFLDNFRSSISQFNLH